MKDKKKPTDWYEAYRSYTYFAEKVLGVRLHKGQTRWIRHSHRRENVLVTGNRWGKSFVSAVKLLYHAVYRPRCRDFDSCGRYRMVVASITQDQANLVFNEVLRLVRQSAVMSDLLESTVRTPFPTATFGNGAVIEARSTQNRGEYLLGNDYDLFIFDEVAFETDPEYVIEEVVLMRLADREGKLDLVSTPNGKNWFYRRVREIEQKNRPGYVQSGDSRENKHISRKFLKERLSFFSDRRISQNIMGQFVDSGGEILRGGYIDRALANGRAAAGFIRACRTNAVLPTATDTRDTISDRSSGKEMPRFLSGWDLARKRTATVGITIALRGECACVVALERLRQFDWNVVIERIKQRQRRFPGTLVVDATGLGDVVAEQLADYHPAAIVFTEKTKAELLTNVELFHAQDRLAYDRGELPDGPGRTWSFEDELRAARWDDNNELDSLMALALALWPLRTRAAILPPPRLAKI